MSIFFVLFLDKREDGKIWQEFAYFYYRNQYYFLGNDTCYPYIQVRAIYPMDKKTSLKSEKTELFENNQIEKNKIKVLIKHCEAKSKQIQKRISQNEVKLESMVSHSDYEYKDLLRESTESERDHKKDLKLLMDLLCKYNIEII